MLYSYEAFDKSGAPVNGETDVPSEKELVIFLEQKGLTPSKIRVKGKQKGIMAALNTDAFAKIKDEDRIFMVRNLATAIKAGLSINEALTILVNDSKPGLMHDILMTAKVTVQSGRPLSDGLALHKKHFPPIFIGLLRAGEASSQLDKSLEELGTYLAKEYNLIRKIKSALTYPIMLLIGSFGVVVFLLVFVLPKLSKTFALSGTELPLVTKILVNTSSFLIQNLMAAALLLIAAIAGIIYGLRTEQGRDFKNKVAVNTPVVKDLIKKVALVRFTRTLQSLFSGSTPVLKALEISADAVGNDIYKKAILDVAGNMKVGVPLSRSLEKHPTLFPTLLISLIGVGERTGNLEYVLRTFSNFYDEEVENKLKDITGLFEPILLIVMGLIVGTIAVAVLLPIYQLVGKFT